MESKTGVLFLMCGLCLVSGSQPNGIEVSAPLQEPTLSQDSAKSQSEIVHSDVKESSGVTISRTTQQLSSIKKEESFESYSGEYVLNDIEITSDTGFSVDNPTNSLTDTGVTSKKQLDPLSDSSNNADTGTDPFPDTKATSQREIQFNSQVENKEQNEAPLNPTSGFVKQEKTLIDSDHIEKEEAKVENQNSFLSDILKSIVDPVFEDFEKESELRKVEEANSSDIEVVEEINNQTEESLPVINTTNSEKNNVNTTVDKRFRCTGKNATQHIGTVQIVNNTGLLGLLNFEKNESMSDCVLVLFFAPWCPFCARMAANYNALARAFPQLEVLAVDAAQFSNLNARFGTVLVPNILLFHQSRAVVRFNQTEKSFENLSDFVKNVTGLEPNSTVTVTKEDEEGPLRSVPTDEPDYLLWMAWLFVIIFTFVIFIQSALGQQYINKVRLLWQEHQHID